MGTEAERRESTRRVAPRGVNDSESNLPDDEQEAHARPTGWDEVAQHAEIPSFSSGRK